MVNRLLARSWLTLAWLAALAATTALACNMQPQPTALPTSTPLPRLCREYRDIPLPVGIPPDPTAYQNAIQAFLSSGGSPDALREAMRQWGVLGQPAGLGNPGGIISDDYDFDQDGFYDILVSFHYPTASASPQQPGQLLILGCRGADQPYSVLYGYASAPNSALGMPQVQIVQDITNDGLPDLVFTVEQCTRLACFREPYIMSWDQNRGTMRALSEPFSRLYIYRDDSGNPIRGLPFAGLELGDTGNPHLKNVIIQEGAILQREAGPQRPARHTWAWRNDQYVYVSMQQPPSSYLIHVLRDADARLRVGNLEEAVALYNSVIHEGEPAPPGQAGSNNATYPELIPWGGIFPGEDSQLFEEQMLKAYARYRLVLAHTALRNGFAQMMLAEMQAALPYRVDDPPSYYTLLATRFLSRFLESSQGGTGQNALALACELVREEASAPDLARTYEYLADPNYFGPTLANYTVQDLCPF